MRILDFTSITEEQGKTAVFAFGRMNPPTIGHKKLADAVLAQAGDPYIFLSQSQKPQTDPLDFATKLKFAQKFFPGITVGDPEVKTVIQALTKLDQLGYDNIIYIAGSDRIADFTELLNQYNGQPDKKGNVAYKFNDIQVVSAGERDPDAEGAEGMSASKMRAAAAAGEFEAFASGTPDPKLAKPMYDAVRSGMGITETTHAQRMLKVIETLSDLNRINPFDQETNTYILEQVSIIKEHLSFQKKDKDLSEAYSPEIDDKWIEREIRASAKKHGIDPNVAVRVWRSEGGSSKNYQSKIKRSGKGSVGGQEASYGPYQLYTGGGLGNEYQEKYGVDLSADNSPEGLQRQIDFALGKAKQVGWKPWYGAAKAGIGDRDGIDGTQYADAGNIATDASVDNSGPSDFGAAFASARKKHGAGGKFKWQGKEYQTNVKGEKYVTNPVSVDEAFKNSMGVQYETPFKAFEEAVMDFMPDTAQEIRDFAKKWAIRNRQPSGNVKIWAEKLIDTWRENEPDNEFIKDGVTDEHGQPVAVTNKGDQKIFKGRVKKLMPTEGKSPHKKGTKKYRKHMAAMHAGMNEAKKSGSYLLQLERDNDLLVLHIKNTKTGQRTEVRGKPGYELDGYDATDPLHQMLDKVGKAANISDLMNGDVVSINPNHPDGPRAREEFKQITDEGVSYADPQFDVEWEEANRYPYLEKLGPEGWEELAKTGRAVRVTTDSVKKIGNTGADGSESLDDLEPEKVARLKQAMDSGTVEMPIVVKQPDGSLELIAGNTRLIGLISTQGEAQVWLVDASTLTEDESRDNPDFNLSDISPELRPAIRQAMIRFPMAKDRLSAVIRMMQQDNEKQQKNIKNINRLDTENDIQDVEIDTSEDDITSIKNKIAALEKRISSEQDITNLKNKISDLEARIVPAKESMVKEGVGRIVKGVNTTPDVGVNQTKIEAAKLGSKVDKDGRPPLLHKKAAKNSDTNTLFNLGLAEGKLSENNKSHAVVIKFVNHCKDKLELPNIPTITLVDRIGGKTFGQYDTVKKDIAVQLADRHIVDVLRTLAHELVHHKQRHLHSKLDGSDGSDHENQANALAGKLMRQFGKRYPKLYEGLQERASIGVPLSSGLTVNIAPHRELKIKKSTMGRHNYENPRTKKSRKSK
jgi:chorismate mutase